MTMVSLSACFRVIYIYSSLLKWKLAQCVATVCFTGVRFSPTQGCASHVTVDRSVP